MEEVSIKQARIKDFLEANQLEAVLLKKQANFSWFTAGGLNLVGIASDTGVTTLLVTKTKRYVIANKIEAMRMMDEEGLKELGFELLEHEWYVDREVELIQQVCGVLKQVGADVVFGECPNVDGELKKLRYSLTENEIQRYQFLGKQLSIAVEKTLLGVKPGDSECEIAGRVGRELWKDRIDPTGFMVAADERVFSYRHPIPTERLVKRYVMLCVNARYKGLITTITRILHFGKIDPKLLQQYRDNIAIECRMIEATRPGQPVVLAFEAALKAYEEFGYKDQWVLHHQGGSMGYYARDLKVTAATKEKVWENQAYCWNPSISGTKSEDGFIATVNGPIAISAPVIFPALSYNLNGVQIFKPDIMVVD